MNAASAEAEFVERYRKRLRQVRHESHARRQFIYEAIGFSVGP